MSILPRPTRTAAPVVLALALALAACGDAASPSPTGAERNGDTASVAASPSLELPDDSAQVSPPDASGPASVPELEELIPDEIGGIPIEKQSQRGDEFIASQEADELTREFLTAIEVEPDDVTVAVGFGLDQEAGDGVGIFVFRAEGADPEALVREFKAVSDTERDEPLEWETVTVGGKEVERTEDPLQGGQVVHLYSRDDTLFLVTATSDELAEETFEALP